MVAGDPLADVTMLQKPEKIALVIKDGEIAANRLTAAERHQKAHERLRKDLARCGPSGWRR